ncbi:aminopeptidase C [Gardnerella vaginalis]|uniref:aminopeptidase C n=1 Tax=Gardnerella vaginalis TaxID=2702 RepID=UPI0007F8C5C0|nr:C1 family peptidase [Gardnerella vaginalis]PKY96631.1 aminopeptidase [Gardnerella vaginalis]
MSENVKAVTIDNVHEYSKHFNEQRANRVAANASVASGVLKAATSYQGQRALPRNFSIELKQGSITNQQHSGRCWMFASLNTLRYELMHKWNLDDFEFSESYLFFWDKIEKANAYLENVLATLDETLDSRVFENINYGPIDDGGWWQMFVNLVNKYGLVPKSAYPDSQNAIDSDAFVQYINTKLREFAAELREAHKNGTSIEELREMKIRDLETVYRMTAIALGEPPERFDFIARTKDDDDKKDEKDDKKNEAKEDDKKDDKPKTGKDDRPMIREYGITPLEFAKKYVPIDVNDFVSLCNSPMEHTPFNKLYQLKYTTNVAETKEMEFANVALEVFRKAAVDQLKDGHPIWFACDCTQFSLRQDGFFDPAVVRVDELFDVEFTFDKAKGLEYMDCPGNHAMTFTGVNLNKDGEPDRWKIENSWGKDNGEDGYYVGSAQWFDRYVTEIIINKKYLDEATRAILDQEPVMLDPWIPLTKRCR